jgi:hypothetical protein
VIVNPDWQKLIGEIWEIEAILAQDVMIMNPTRFAQVVAMARCTLARADRARHNAGRVW